MDYQPVIGLEVHIQLKTRTKLFCSCPVEFGEEPNTIVCPVCLGFPGVLPVLNDEAVRLGIKAALALNCQVQRVSSFSRKHYFYPDLPKGYQITQQERPLAINGCLETKGKEIRIRQLHLEEDAGKLLHTRTSTLVDFNRCGIPLIEIVTEPDFESPEEVISFFTELRSILRYTDVSSGDMEKGHIRCELNVSLKRGEEFGVRREIKNLNSLKSVREALNYEFNLQRMILASGGQIEQETLLWDEREGKTKPMRKKEEAEDYRYFLEPDLPPLVISEEEIERLRKELPELPKEKRRRFVSLYQLSEYEAGILTRDKGLAEYYEEVVKGVGGRETGKLAANWVINEVVRMLNEENLSIEEFKISPRALSELLTFLKEGKITQRSAKEVFFQMARGERGAKEIIEKEGLEKEEYSSELEDLVREVIKEYPEAVLRYKKGKEGVLSFLLGQVMKKTKGRFSPEKIREKLKSEIDNS